MSPAAPAFLDRRGASDQDRPAWLAGRRNGVTATEVAKLGAYKTNAARQKAMGTLAVEKISGDDGFSGNRYTEWGVEREPVLEEWAHFMFGFTPESRLAYAEDDIQHIASIDAWRVDDDGTLHLAEFKTSGKQLTWAILVEKGYVDQALWQMYVTGAQSNLVMWEERLDDGKGGFKAGVRGTILVARDEARIAVLVGYATAFLLVLMERMTGSDGSVDDPMLDDIVTRLQDAKATVAELDPKVRAMMTSSGVTSSKTAHWNVSYEAADAKAIPDPEAFEKAHPKEVKRLKAIDTARAALVKKHAAELAELDASVVDEVATINALRAPFTKLGDKPNPVLRITARKDAK